MVQPLQKKRAPWRETPLVESANLSRAAGCRIFLKCENLQPSGSFKSRGLGLLVLRSLKRAKNPEKVHFYSSSGGNAGMGCVQAANFVGRPSTVVVPLATKPMMVSKIRAAGATRVIQHGTHWREADDYLREVVMREGEALGEEPIYVSPFDHPDIWEGHSSIIDEIHQQMEDESPPDLIVCSVGGGGLFNGIMQGIERQPPVWQHTQVLGMETHGADALAYALDADEHLFLPKVTSIATTLGASRVSARTFELAREGRRTGRFHNAVLSDAEAAMGCWRLADDERMLVELACGVSAAVCYDGRLEKALGRPVRPDQKVVIVLCGGSAVSIDMVEGWRREFGGLENPGTGGRLGDVPSEVNIP